MSWRTVKFDGKIDFSAFICDEPILNDYLHQKAALDQENDLCTLYFLINDKNDIGGYYVVSNGSIRRQELPTAKARKNLPGYPLAAHQDNESYRIILRYCEVTNQGDQGCWV